MSYIPRYASQDNEYVASSLPDPSISCTSRTSDLTLTSADSGYFSGRGGGALYNNEGATGNVTFTLPESPPLGTSFVFLNSQGTHRLTVLPSGSDRIIGGGGDNKTSAYTTQQCAIIRVSYLLTNRWVAENFGSATYTL